MAAGKRVPVRRRTRTTRARKPHRRRAVREAAWTRLSDEELLQKRFCDLRLTLRHTMIEGRLERIRRDLRRRGIRFRPHVWLSTEWFSPDGVPGIAVPFYMVHPRLMRLERRFMNEVEGGNASWLTRILRHELGHALDNAYRLRRRKGWRRTFGKASHPYPEIYQPRPASRDFVLHLGHWYAQSHPTEDFAETFAVWLQPRARWRREYQGWPALRKLEYVDAVMASIQGERAAVMNRELIEPLSENTRTLAQHYERKRARYEFEMPEAYDLRLKRVFGRRRHGRRQTRASTFVRLHQPEIERFLLRRSRLHPYLVHHVIRTVIQRCRKLNLVVNSSQREAKRAVLGVIERILLDILRRDRERYAL
ncbi:MAG TPA: putative zinc-binding metallopeptidase [Steroidobacter sp.]|nr:putative zinc-binding metallopeptidase [Steroidobacter sp.]